MTAVLVVCARNGGTSQMAAGLRRDAAPALAVDSAARVADLAARLTR